MTITLDTEAVYILYTLKKAGFDAYIVGGAVRDLLLSNSDRDITITDYDFTTNAKPEEILKLFTDSFYENSFGTVSITREHLREQLDISTEKKNDVEDAGNRVIDVLNASKVHESLNDAFSLPADTGPASKDVFEITTYRSDGAYTNHRHPESITWGKTLDEDLDRRDFTINALALTIPQSILTDTLGKKNLPALTAYSPKEYTIVDSHGGQEDLSAGIIKTVGNPNQRFTEDALRILRAIRFSVQLDMQIENETYEAIITNAHLLKHISAERLREEFLKMLSSNFPREAIEILDDSKCLSALLPELLDAKGVQQGGHHTTDVWEHSLSALAHCPSADPIVRLATLIHDIGKPATFKLINDAPTFYNHEVIGSRIAKTISRRFKLSKRESERLFILVRYHMFYYQPENTDASIRRFMRKVGLDNIDDILDLREGDRLGSGAKKTSWRLEEMKQRMISQLHQPFEIKDMAIGGHELMEELGLAPGPELGRILKALFEKVLEEPELNTKEKLFPLAKELL